jgi:hypothetical protein
METTQKVQCEYEVLDFFDKEGIEDFTMRLSGMVNQLAVLGDLETEPDDKVIILKSCTLPVLDSRS